MRKKYKIVISMFFILLLTGVGVWLYRIEPFKTKFEVRESLGGNLFPSLLLSTATTDTVIVQPMDTAWLGNPKSGIGVFVSSSRGVSRVRIHIGETAFSYESISEFVLEKSNTDYLIYPEIGWKYDVLRNNTQALPISLAVSVEKNKVNLGTQIVTLSVRSINECMLGYVDYQNRYRDTSIMFAAYVNEDNDMIDGLLREALNSRIVNRFWGYQDNNPRTVDKQVYALWHVLQKRNFKYSSISNSSLSSNVVFAQRVRTFDDALKSAQINCVDGSVMFASLLRAINIDPVLVKTPTHMFVGYYLDRQHSDTAFVETSMIGDVNLDDYFPEEQLDSTMVGKSQKQVSSITFEKAKEYAGRMYEANRAAIESRSQGFTVIEISDAVRRKIQPIGL